MNTKEISVTPCHGTQMRLACFAALLAVLSLAAPARAAMSSSACAIALRLDCLTVSTNTTKRGFAALAPENQNPAVYLTRDNSYSGTNYGVNTTVGCVTCHERKSKYTSETWKFTGSFILSPTNTARSGHIFYNLEENGTNFVQCTSDRSTSGTDSWSNGDCGVGIAATQPFTNIVTPASSQLILTNFFYDHLNGNSSRGLS